MTKIDLSNFLTIKSNSIYKRSADLFFFLFCILYTNGRASDFFLPFCSPRARSSSRQSRSAENTKHEEESVLEKQIKPHRNLFTPTIAQKNKHLTTTALLPKDKKCRQPKPPAKSTSQIWYSNRPANVICAIIVRNFFPSCKRYVNT